MTVTVSVYQRAGCHLCEVATEQLIALQAQYDFVIEQVDIETDPVLHARYLERIPVISIDGEELYDFELDLADLKRRIATVHGR